MATQNNNNNRNYREDVTNELISLIESGNAPWQKPWDPKMANALLEFPRNGDTDRPYNGANSLYLMSKAHKLGQGDDPRWLTYKQAKDNGWQVRRGEKGTTVEYWKWDRQVEVKNEETDEIKKKTVKLKVPVAFYATVFHASQIDGIPAYIPKGRGYEWDSAAEADKILTASGAKIIYDQQNRAYYSPMADDIHLPPKEAFPEPLNYYETALHELSHWTGHDSRLKRDLSGSFGTESYAREELRAEIASLYLSIETGVPFSPGKHGGINIDNTAAYTKSWIAVLKSDKNEIFRAAKDAEIITDYVLGLAKDKNIILDQTIKPIIKTEAQKLAYQLGAEAFQKGKQCIPILEKNVKEELGYLPVGKEALDFLDHWEKGWNESKLNNEVNNPLPLTEKIQEAALLGEQAFLTGKTAIPANDKDLMQLLEGLKDGESGAEITKAWSDKWHETNLKQATPSNLSPLSILIAEHKKMHSDFTKENYDAIEKDIMKLRELDVNFATKAFEEGNATAVIGRALEISSPLSSHDSQLRKTYVDEILHEIVVNYQEKINKQNQSTKIPVASIYIDRAEGLIEECGKPVTLTTFAAADVFLREQAKTAPNFGYDKTDFTVKWADGSEYQGRFDMQSIDQYRTQLLQTQMKEGIEFYAGIRRPSHYKDQDWDRHLNRIDPEEVEERKEWLRTGEGLDVVTPTIQNAASIKEAVTNFIPSEGPKNLTIEEAFKNHIETFIKNYPGIADNVTYSNRKELQPLTNSIALTMLKDGHNPLDLIRTINNNNPFLDDRSDGYQAVNKAHHTLFKECVADKIQATLEASFTPNIRSKEEIQVSQYERDTKCRIEYESQICEFKRDCNRHEIPLYITEAVDTKVTAAMLQKDYTPAEIVEGMTGRWEDKRRTEYASKIVGNTYTTSLYTASNSDLKVIKALLTTQLYQKKDILAFIEANTSTNLPSRSDDRRKHLESTYRKAQKEIKLTTPENAKGIAI